jgi:hypothetical protein
MTLESFESSLVTILHPAFLQLGVIRLKRRECREEIRKMIPMHGHTFHFHHVT